MKVMVEVEVRETPDMDAPGMVTTEAAALAEIMFQLQTWGTPEQSLLRAGFAVVGVKQV